MFYWMWIWAIQSHNFDWQEGLGYRYLRHGAIILSELTIILGSWALCFLLFDMYGTRPLVKHHYLLANQSTPPHKCSRRKGRIKIELVTRLEDNYSPFGVSIRWISFLDDAFWTPSICFLHLNDAWLRVSLAIITTDNLPAQESFIRGNFFKSLFMYSLS